jgi:hypothetical protein
MKKVVIAGAFPPSSALLEVEQAALEAKSAVTRAAWRQDILDPFVSQDYLTTE